MILLLLLSVQNGFWSPALGKQGGTIILVRENSDFEIKKWQQDSSGRIVSILASLGELNFDLVNIYEFDWKRCFYENLQDFFHLKCFENCWWF